VKDYEVSNVYYLSDTKALSSDSALECAKQIVWNSPALSKRVNTMQYTIQYSKPKSNSTLKILPYKASAMNGIRPCFAVVDETHLMKDSKVIDTLASGMLKVSNSMLIIISTRGTNITYFQYALEQVYNDVIECKQEDETTFIMIFEQDSEEEANKPETWIKSNPNIGVTHQLIDLQDLYIKAKLTPASLIEFFTLNLNMWVAGKEAQFIEQEFIDAAYNRGVDNHINLEFFRDKDVYIGMDLSKTNDLSSVVVLHVDKHKHFYAYPIIYFPNLINRKARARGINLSKWLLSGEIKQCEGARIDYQMIIDDLIYINSICKIKNFGHDGYNQNEIVPTLESVGIFGEVVGQGIFNLSQSTKLLDRIMVEHRISYTNEAFRWQFSNAIAYYDDNNNLKCSKKKSRDSIDSVYALLDAIYLWQEENDSSFTKPYEALKISL
jgi:phage terminase large subunit-like protein